ncbi:MAG TPA: efflux RND transporter periplasmic adaptor subunit [Thermoanaerobaculia bacterium]|nr:efflux RND transporter periplasmic adaptor subunit [Thermoanaerobaculia bacterium]
MRSPWFRRGGVLLGIVAAVLLLRATLFRPDPVPVTVVAAAKGTVEETVAGSRAGTMRSRRRATLSPEVGGRVERLAVREGDRVKKGDLLVRIAADDVKAQVALAEKSLAVAQAAEVEACRAAEQARRDLARSRSLAKDEVLSVGLLEKAETEAGMTGAACEAARARVGQARAALDVARIALAKTVLKAPFDGVVAEVSTEEGEWVTPSPPGLPIPPVVELFDPDDVYVSAPLDEVDVGRVKKGAEVRVTFDAYPGRTFAGRVTRVADYVLDQREQNRTFEVEVALDDSSFARTLLPGTSADAVVVLARKEEVLRVPAYAILPGGRILVLSKGRLAGAKVETGLKGAEWAEVVSGLSAGDLVVTSLDRPEVKEGARARAEEAR